MKKRNVVKRIARITLSVLLALLLGAAGLLLLCRGIVRTTAYRLYYQGELNAASGYTCIVVPGAGLQDSRPGVQLKDRLDTAAALYKNGAADKILLSGGRDEESGLYESKVMQVYLKGLGIPKEALLRDDYGVDTAETLRRTKALCGDGRVIVCTQSLYAPRTAYLAKAFSLDCDIADSDIRIYTEKVGEAQLREFFAATKAVFDGVFNKGGSYPLADYPLTGGDADA